MKVFTGGQDWASRVRPILSDAVPLLVILVAGQVLEEYNHKVQSKRTEL